MVRETPTATAIVRRGFSIILEAMIIAALSEVSSKDLDNNMFSF